ncbi:hypothetical protein HK097_008450 [Rhizophlyctis rosea]|uniref:Uncharacterized protein n=1 Tax=Rhizophlyctis rosea TaxID=64517 RepID=A0AAD5SKV6_9FUNG|nr:hypothetical protein HK097_008450 [Rhizophlyctis rosea]
MRSYEKVPDSEPETLDQPTSSTPLTQPQSSSLPPAYTPQSRTDGVFANLIARTDTSSSSCPPTTSQPPLPTKQFQEMEPPAYNDVVSPTPSMPLYETTIVTSFAEDGDILIDGLPVGGFFAFFVNMLVSMSFDFIGFLLTTILATSHAAKCGSRSGLGMTLIRYGLFMQARTYDRSDYPDQYDPTNPDADVDYDMSGNFLGYIFMIVGFMILIRANADFVKIIKMRNIILSTAGGAMV